MKLKRRRPRSLYAEGWGPAKAKDARLKGWSPLELVGPVGSRAEVISVEDRVIGPPHAQEPALYVVARVTTPEGASWVIDDLLLRPTTAEVWEMTELADYLGRIVGGRDPAALRETQEQAALSDLSEAGTGGVLRYADGPPLRPVDFLQCMEAVELWRKVLDGEPSDTVTVSRADLEAALDWAFLAGRRVAAAEVPGQLQRTKALAEARRRAAEAKAWWPDGARWAQSLIADWPKDQRCSLAALALKMWSNWSTGPLGLGVARRNARYLETDILPQWRDGGLIVLPDGAVEP